MKRKKIFILGYVTINLGFLFRKVNKTIVILKYFL